MDGLRLLCLPSEGDEAGSHGGYSGKASWTILLRAMRDLGFYTGASHLINDLRADLFHGWSGAPEPERKVFLKVKFEMLAVVVEVERSR